jgi:hypothetical protein
MKHPRKGENKKQGANSLKDAGDPEERETLRTEPSTSHMKRVNLY